MKKNVKIKNAVLLVGIIISTLFFACSKDNNNFRFVFMTDIHIQQERRGAEGFEAAINKANTLQPDFVITGGDLIMDALEQPHERATMLYNLYQEKLEKFTMPVYNTIGNHENFGLYKKSGIDPDHPDYGKNMFKRILGDNKTYYSFDHKGWHFIILDAIGYTPDRHYIGKIDSVQMQWLAADLKSIAPETPIVVSLHIPLTSVFEQMRHGATTALSDGAVVTNSKEVLDLFENRNLKLVLQGHLHCVEDISYNGTHFITGGAVCGAWWKGARAGFPEGFVVVDVKGDDFTWKYETFGWKAVVEAK